jgi:hypothetical protein
MCVGGKVDSALGSLAQPYAPGKLKNYVPSLGESLDPHYFRTNDKGEARHRALGVHQGIDMPPPPPELQDGKTPDMAALTKQRKAFAKVNGGTLLTSPSGVSITQQNLGSTLLGG